MRLKTERLILRDYCDEDKADLVANINDEDVTKYLRKVPFPYTEADAEWYLNKCKVDIAKNPRQEHSFVIELKETGEFMGSVGLHEIDDFGKEATVGYWLGKKGWRNGYMYEAAKEVLRFAFEDIGLRRIDIEADVDNEPSNGLIKKLGFQYEGMRCQYRKTKSTGKTPDANQYGMLKEDWEELKNK